MLYCKNLYDQIFDNYPSSADKLIILSGYLGPSPVQDLKNLPLNSEVIFGLFKENQKKSLHDEFLKLHDSKTQILYAEVLSHSKCYVWLKDGQPIRGLIGSANFSSNGLTSDYRETLFEVDKKEVHLVNAYINIIKETSKKCCDVILSETAKLPIAQQNRASNYQYIEGTAILSLYQSNGIIPRGSGINWGMSTESHVNPDDAYLAININHIRKHPDLFQPATLLPKHVSARSNESEIAELIWDDGEVMRIRFEGSQKLDGVVYRKQISSYPRKDILGKYLKRRLQVPEGSPVQQTDLLKYGRDNIFLSKLEEGVYFADFKSLS